MEEKGNLFDYLKINLLSLVAIVVFILQTICDLITKILIAVPIILIEIILFFVLVAGISLIKVIVPMFIGVTIGEFFGNLIGLGFVAFLVVLVLYLINLFTLNIIPMFLYAAYNVIVYGYLGLLAGIDLASEVISKWLYNKCLWKIENNIKSTKGFNETPICFVYIVYDWMKKIVYTILDSNVILPLIFGILFVIVLLINVYPNANGLVAIFGELAKEMSQYTLGQNIALMLIFAYTAISGGFVGFVIVSEYKEKNVVRRKVDKIDFNKLLPKFKKKSNYENKNN